MTSNSKELIPMIPNTDSFVKAHIAKGLYPFPLPAGEKFPPYTGVTGRVPDQTKNVIEGHNGNVGLRVQAVPGTKHEVLIIDVDHYEEKTGYDAFTDLCKGLGLSAVELLDSTVRVSRRGADNPGGHYYFTVPAGVRWNSDPCAGVDVVQMGHRYGLAPGSVVDGLEYKCYKGLSAVEVNLLDADYPELPLALQDRLSMGKAQSRHQPHVWYNSEQAEQWLEAILIDPHKPVNADTALVSFPQEDFDNNGHDTMIKAVHYAIRSGAVDGFTGTLTLLEAIKRRFAEAVKDRRSQQGVESEYNRALNGEVEKLRGEVDNSNDNEVVLAVDLLTGLKSTLIADAEKARRELERKHQLVFNIASHVSLYRSAELIVAMDNELFAVEFSGEGGSEVEIRQHKPMGKLANRNLRCRINDIYKVVCSARATLDEDEDEVLFARVNELLSELRADSYRAAFTALVESIANELEGKNRLVGEHEVNRDPNLIGVGDDVLDYELVKANPDGELTDWLRPREIEDRVTRSVEYPDNVRRGWANLKATSMATRTQQVLDVIFPDKELQDYALSCMGYALHGANPGHKVFVMYGRGGSGKGTLFEMTEAAFGGDYVSQIKQEAFVKGSSDRPDPAYSDSLKTRLTFIDEAEKPVSAAALKMATQERYSRFLHSNNVVRTSGNTIVFATNHAFEINRDSGVERRLVVLPFTARNEAVIGARGDSKGWMFRPEERAYMLYLLAKGMYRAKELSENLNLAKAPEGVRNKTEEFLGQVDDLYTAVRSLVEVTGVKSDKLVEDELLAYLRHNRDVAEACQLSTDTKKRVRKILVDIGAESPGSRGRVKIDGKLHRGYTHCKLVEGLPAVV